MPARRSGAGCVAACATRGVAGAAVVRAALARSMLVMECDSSSASRLVRWSAGVRADRGVVQRQNAAKLEPTRCNAQRRTTHARNRRTSSDHAERTRFASRDLQHRSGRRCRQVRSGARSAHPRCDRSERRRRRLPARGLARSGLRTAARRHAWTIPIRRTSRAPSHASRRWLQRGRNRARAALRATQLPRRTRASRRVHGRPLRPPRVTSIARVCRMLARRSDARCLGRSERVHGAPFPTVIRVDILRPAVPQRRRVSDGSHQSVGRTRGRHG